MAAARFALPDRISTIAPARRATGARAMPGSRARCSSMRVLIVALLQYAPVRRSIAHMAPIMVSVITPPPPETPRPPPKLPLHRKPPPAEAPPPVAPPR